MESGPSVQFDPSYLKDVMRSSKEAKNDSALRTELFRAEFEGKDLSQIKQTILSETDVISSLIPDDEKKRYVALFDEMRLQIKTPADLVGEKIERLVSALPYADGLRFIVEGALVRQVLNETGFAGVDSLEHLRNYLDKIDEMSTDALKDDSGHSVSVSKALLPALDKLMLQRKNGPVDQKLLQVFPLRYGLRNAIESLLSV